MRAPRVSQSAPGADVGCDPRGFKGIRSVRGNRRTRCAGAILSSGAARQLARVSGLGTPPAARHPRRAARGNSQREIAPQLRRDGPAACAALSRRACTVACSRSRCASAQVGPSRLRPEAHLRELARGSQDPAHAPAPDDRFLPHPSTISPTVTRARRARPARQRARPAARLESADSIDALG